MEFIHQVKDIGKVVLTLNEVQGSQYPHRVQGFYGSVELYNYFCDDKLLHHNCEKVKQMILDAQQ